MFSFLDLTWSRIASIPKYRRMYWQALQELANGPMLPERINPLMDAKYAAFSAAGLNVTSPAATEAWIASARNSILTQTAAANAADFTLTYTNYTASANAVT